MRSSAHARRSLQPPPRLSRRAARARTRRPGIAIVHRSLPLLGDSSCARSRSAAPAGYVLVSGQSMEPRHHTGDLVLVERHASYASATSSPIACRRATPMAGAQVIHRIIGGNAKHGFIVQRRQPHRAGRVAAQAAATSSAPQGCGSRRSRRAPVPARAAASSRCSPRAFVFVHVLAGTGAAGPTRTTRRMRRRSGRPHDPARPDLRSRTTTCARCSSSPCSVSATKPSPGAQNRTGRRRCDAPRAGMRDRALGAAALRRRRAARDLPQHLPARGKASSLRRASPTS